MLQKGWFVMGRISGELLMEAIRKIPEVTRAIIGGRVHPNILQAFIDGDEVEVVKILTLSALAAKKRITSGQFNELVNEVSAWELLDQIDGLNLVQSERLHDYLVELWSKEEGSSDVGYPKGFCIQTPEEQLKIWQEHFPKLDGNYVLAFVNQSSLPTGAEGWAVIPKFLMVGDGDY